MTRIFFLLILTAGMELFATGQTVSNLTIETESGEAHAFNIELADTPELITRGLMERDSLAADAGMLFDFGETRATSMWMKNTPLSLDMLFLNRSGHILAIAHNTVPHSERLIDIKAQVRAVLEINAGTARTLNIEPGSIVRHALFDNVNSGSAPSE